MEKENIFDFYQYFVAEVLDYDSFLVRIGTWLIVCAEIRFCQSFED